MKNLKWFLDNYHKKDGNARNYHKNDTTYVPVSHLNRSGHEHQNTSFENREMFLETIKSWRDQSNLALFILT